MKELDVETMIPKVSLKYCKSYEIGTKMTPKWSQNGQVMVQNATPGHPRAGLWATWGHPGDKASIFNSFWSSFGMQLGAPGAHKSPKIHKKA